MGIDAQMLIRTKQPLTSERVRKLAVELHQSFGETVLVLRPGDRHFHPEGRHCLEIVEEYGQDGESIFPEPGEQLIECHLYGRYYGVEYERGDLPSILMVAQWLEDKIPGAEVWYGGDSSGVLAEPFGPAERAALWRHFLDNAHRPYHGHFGSFFGNEKPPLCDFCGGEPMVNHGGGQGYSFYACHGCGWHIKVFPNGTIEETDKNFDMFKKPA